MTGASPAIQIDITRKQGTFKLDVAFESTALANAVFGPSGSGKTTILNIIAGLERPDRGRIAINGHVLCDTERGIDVPVHKRRIGFVHQDSRLFPHFTVQQNIAFAQWFAGGQTSDVHRDIVIDILGLGQLLDRRPARLSGGEKQRVALARALLSAPKLLILDEPLASLDDNLREEILPLLERIRDEFKIPLIYVTHSRAEVLRLATWVALIRDGLIVATGKPADLLGQANGYANGQSNKV